MSLTQAQIKHLKKLSALSGEASLEISSVLDSFSLLEKAQTQNAKKIERSGNNTLILREDISKDSWIQNALLDSSPQKIMANQIVLAGIMTGE